MYKYFIYFYLLFYCLLSSAEITSGYGEYFFGPETSEMKACENAQNKAKAMAISSVLGESFFSEQQMYCKDSNIKKLSDQCEYNNLTWSFIEGDIKNISNFSAKIEKRTGSSVCIVTLNADVMVPKIKPDPNFQVKAQRQKYSYKAGDDFTIEFETTLPAYFAIFNWLPNENNKINRILISPSVDKYDSDSLRKNKEGKYHFKQTFTAYWSNAYKDDVQLYDEWILLVVTKTPYKWLNTYDFEEFKQKLREIPIDQRRLEKLGYQLYK
jgi:hypothetical protein